MLRLLFIKFVFGGLLFEDTIVSAVLLGCLFWPLWGAFICGFFGFRLGSQLVGRFAALCLVLSFLNSIVLFYVLTVCDFSFVISVLPCFTLAVFLYPYPFLMAKVDQLITMFTIYAVEAKDFTRSGMLSVFSGYVLPPTVSVDWEFLFDSITGVMLFVICSISCLVHIYSLSYMKTDPQDRKSVV